MKNFFATAVAVMLLICATACSAADKTLETTTTPSTSVETEDKTPKASLVYAENLLKEYRAEVKRRVESNKSFDFYENASADDFYILSMLVKRNEPMLYNDELLHIYTTPSGGVLIKETSNYFRTNWFGNVHFDYDSDALILGKITILSSNEDRAVVLNSETSVAKLYKLGTEIDEVSVTGEYCGYSRQIGAIFRDGEKVYLLSTTSDSENGLSFEQIATGVECVVEASYDASSDLWGLPLFLMKDGSLKFYQPAYSNSASALMEPIYEGGYH